MNMANKMAVKIMFTLDFMIVDNVSAKYECKLVKHLMRGTA